MMTYVLFFVIVISRWQVTVHVKGKTECYECQPKPAPKTYPVCTITSTPSKVNDELLMFLLVVIIFLDFAPSCL